jgi:hypothetical protein
MITSRRESPGTSNPVAQRVGSEQGGARIIAENVDEGPGVDRIDVLGKQRQSLAREVIGDSRMDRLQSLDRR